jgi:TolB protein
MACGSSGPGPAEATNPPPHPAAEESTQGVIAQRTAPVPEASDPNERVIFLRAGSVWMMRPDGSDAEQLTVRSLEAADHAPAVAPDGRHLAYASAKDGARKIYVQNFEDMIPMAVTSGEGGGDDEPAWSPDGAQLAFMRGDPREHRDLYVVTLDGETASEPRLVVAGDDDRPELAGAPVWLPGGRSILMSADRRAHQGTGLWRVDVQTGHMSRVSPLPGHAWWVVDREAAVAPDGSRIAFVSNRQGSSADDADEFDLYSIRPDGSGLTRLSDDPGTVAHPAYSPDGKRLFFASTRIRQADFEWELYVMAAGGGAQRRLTRDARPENSSPSTAIIEDLPQ